MFLFPAQVGTRIAMASEEFDLTLHSACRGLTALQNAAAHGERTSLERE
jgi:hypothetical protein